MAVSARMGARGCQAEVVRARTGTAVTATATATATAATMAGEMGARVGAPGLHCRPLTGGHWR